jgi:hypothetical protein
MKKQYLLLLSILIFIIILSLLNRGIEPFITSFEAKSFVFTPAMIENQIEMERLQDNLKLLVGKSFPLQDKVNLSEIKDINVLQVGKENSNYFYDLNEKTRCFNSSTGKEVDILLPQECVSTTDRFGNRIKPNIWDQPCVNNEDCPFYKKNMNYPNSRGGCIAGKCELPLNMRRIGYKYYDLSNQYAPLCGNCPTDDKSNGTCCHNQQNPDYRFENDTNDRYFYKNVLSSKELNWQ